MPLLGKLVVIKRSGGDGTEFPLTASCLFGRKPDCDIRIQLPQVSKEHCRIELNENKELILTNLSSVNPTRINGQVLQQSERLKHGDLITVIDRSFRFEYPPAPTPKKKAPSTAGKGESLQKVLQDQQARDTSASAPPERRKSKQASDNCLKDGSNLPATVENTVETTQNDKEDKPSTHALSPFCELYQMVKQDLDTKSPWKPTKGQPMTPLLRPGSQSPGKQEQKCLTSEVRGISDTVPDGKSTADGPAVAATPKSAQKKRRSSKVKAEERSVIVPLQDEQCVKDAEKPATSQETPGKQSGPSALPQSPARSKGSLGQKSKTPEKFSPEEVVQQILSEPQKCERVPKSPKRRRSEPSLAQSPGTTSSSHTAPENVAAPVSPMVLTPEAPLPTVDIKLDAVVKQSPRTSPRANAGKRFQVQDVLNEVVSAALPETRKSSKKRTSGGQDSDISAPKPKRKRVSFGGQLSPEFFDKRLPPNSPLQRGATPGRRSLGLSVKPQSLLRRASTIGLTRGLKLKETVLESPKAKGSPASKASPKRSSSPAKKANTPSPARKSPDTKGKAPSPKTPKSPVRVAKTPSPARKRASSEASQSPKGRGTKTPPAAKTPSPRRGEETPTVKGRFSISRIGTPSPVADQNEECAAPGSQADCATPKVPLRRQSMKASARKTPGSVMKSALEVMRSRRSGASRANLKVVRSFADVVRFGQTKPQINIANRKPAIRRKITKKSKATTPKTPAQKLRDHFSTGHAASPPTIVIGRSQLRVAQPTGAAPRLVPNFALLKKDMKMDEDFTGVADIFKTPVANKTRKALSSVGDCVETPCGPSGSEMSVISTPEGSGEMTVSPLSVASAVKHYNSEAVSRLLENDQEASFVVDDFTPASDLPVSDTPACEVPSAKPTEEQAAALEMGTKTPKNKPAVASCLTGVKRLMKTPKEKAEPIEDLRGRLLKTPKEQRTQQEENLVGVKELLKTPKHRGVSVKNSPVLCAAGMRRLMKTPKEKRDEVEDVTDLRRLMKTPKVKGVSVEDDLGIERLMKTPRQKKEPVEADLSGAEQQDASTKTPRQKVEPAEDQMCLNRLMTPKNKDEPAEDLPGLQQLMQTPMEKGEPVEEVSTTPEEKNSEVLDAFVEQQELAEELSCSPPEMDKETSNELARSSEASSAAPAHDEAPEGEVNEEMPKHENMEIQSPVEDVVIESAKSDSQCFAAEQMEDIHEPECDTAHESIPQVDEIVGDTHVEQIDTAICDSEEISAALDSSKGMPSVEPEEEPPVSPPVKKTPRGRRPKNVNEQENEVVVKTNVRSRRLNKGNQLLDSLPAPSPVRKSARGRIEKRIEDAPVSKHSVGIQEQGPTSQLAVVKTSRGRKAKQNPVKETTEPFGEVEVAEDTQENADPCVEVAEKSDSPDPSHKSRRGRKIVKRATNTPVMDSDIAETKEKDTELLTSAETEVPTAVPLKPRRGKKSKQEMEKEDERGETVLSDTQNTVSASLAEELPQEGEVRAGRGRRARQGVGKAEPQATNEPKLSAMVKEQEVSASCQKTTSGRGRKAKQPKLQMSEVIDDTQQAVDTSANVTEAREQPEAVVRTGRGGRRMAKPNAQALAQKELEAVTQARPVRGKRAAGVNKDKDKHDSLSDEDGSNVTEATEMEPIVNAARPTRNRKTAVNREPQIVEEAPAEPVASHKKNRGRAKMVDTNIEEEAAPQPCTDETLSTSTEVLGSGVLNKGKGRPSRKRAVVEKSTDIGEAPEGVSDDGQNKGQLLKKSLSWNPNLTSAKDTEEPEPQAKEQLPQKRSRRGFSGTEVNSEGAAESHSQSKPQRGRGAKKLVEPSAAETLSLDADQAKDTKAQPVRRGRTRTTKPLESEPIEDPPSPPKKAAKRKGRGEVSQDVEPENQAMKARDAEAQIDVPPPSKGRRAASKKVETPSDLEVEKKEATIQKETSKVSRGRRKNTQETDAAQTEEEGQVSGGTGGADVTKTNSRGGRRAGSKAQPVTCVETAPAKRTRRK